METRTRSRLTCSSPGRHEMGCGAQVDRERVPIFEGFVELYLVSCWSGKTNAVVDPVTLFTLLSILQAKDTDASIFPLLEGPAHVFLDGFFVPMSHIRVHD